MSKITLEQARIIAQVEQMYGICRVFPPGPRREKTLRNARSYDAIAAAPCECGNCPGLVIEPDGETCWETGEPVDIEELP